MIRRVSVERDQRWEKGKFSLGGLGGGGGARIYWVWPLTFHG